MYGPHRKFPKYRGLKINFNPTNQQHWYHFEKSSNVKIEYPQKNVNSLERILILGYVELK